LTRQLKIKKVKNIYHAGVVVPIDIGMVDTPIENKKSKKYIPSGRGGPDSYRDG
jgi:hypothetical protein